MMTPRFKIVAALAPVLLVALASPLPAQTTRSSTTSNASRTTTSNAARTSTGNSSSSSTSGARQYRSNTLLGDALIQVDSETRSVVIVTDDATHAEIAKVIANLDHPKPQVLIKVVFIEVTLDKDLDVGVEGNYTFNIGHGAHQTIDGTPSDPVSALTSGTGLTGLAGTYYPLATTGGFVQLGAKNWNATLHMLASSGKMQVLSRPSIMARNNQEAVIVVGKEVPLVTSSQVTSEGNTINSIKYQDVGIILRVTPYITSDKTVEMIVAPEISALSDQTVAISSNVNAPIINKRSAETVVVTPNATTVVIGGLMQKDTSTTIQKIPILGDIPLLGHAFRRTVKSDVRSELLIFLTPYIIESTQKLNEVTLNEANRSKAIRENMSPEDIKDNLDTLRLMPELDPASPTKVKTETTIIQTAPAPTPTPTKTQKR